MELMEKKKYQQTKLGLIPQDWKIELFKEVFKVNQGLQIAIEQRQKHPIDISKKYITIQYLNDGKGVEYINDYSEAVCCIEDDVLMTRTGNTGMVITNVNGVFHNNFFKINFDRKKLNKDYIVFYLKSNSTQKRILDKAGTSTIPDLNHNDFYSLEIPLPSTLTEQKAIATALSDLDALIANLDKLIAKKKAIKKGVMQQLLTPPQKGGKRLPGFEGEWVEKTLGEIFDFKTATSKKQFFDLSGDLIVMDMGSVSTEGKILKSKRANCDFDILKRDDLVMPKDDIGGGNIIGKVAYIDKDNSYVLSDHVFKLRPLDDKIDSLYFSYLINSSIVNETILKVVSGSAQLGLGLNIIKHLTVFYNSDNQQQKSIAQILYDMDAEIKSLELKQQKYSNLKQGMMQELLTGKTRLI